MRARRGNGNQFVAGGHFRAINNLGFFDDTHTETSQVVIFAFVHARHLSGFATDQRSAGLFAADTNTVDYIGRNINIQFAGGVIIEEEQRLGAGDYQIVHTHGHQINADAVVLFQVHGQAQLGAHTIGTGNQYRLAVALRQFEQGAEAAQACHYLGAAGPFGNAFDAFNQCITSVDIDACVFVAQGLLVTHAVVTGWPKERRTF